jgi:hypothetical protein
MELIVVGSEYAGKTTLVNQIVPWIDKTMGGGRGAHDHFVIPPAEMTLEDQEYYMKAPPTIKESHQRYMMEYHLHQSFYRDPDHLLVGFHIEEAVYAGMYYGYGGKGQYAERSALARAIEVEVMERAPETILVYLTTDAEVIRERMHQQPRPSGVVREEHQEQGGINKRATMLPRGILEEKDIEHALERFQDEFDASLIRKKIALDTSSSTPESTMAEFVERYMPLMSDRDRTRLLTFRSVMTA